ncbi:MAG: GntR family transcriptional regulator [Candidatus Tectomicrobia bacterium]|uniref:GntR family transcriptional regulator n=1 Tax=Tectimicrobiota bacterium TaxID=2528274 RepID=A0A932HVL2_UNCTE|nr:GntR family transcriptional regulator [Candidatus Tectomicrobia bacterium]
MERALGEVPVYKTKKDMAYERLRAEIVTGALHPGERLILREVAARLGTSLLPVREAIQRLEGEGFVISSPHVGARIVFPDLDRITETLTIRACLESLALRLSAPLTTEPDFAALDRILRDTESACARGETAEINRLNRMFHLRLFDPCPLPRLKKMILDLWDESSMSSNLLYFFDPARAGQNLMEHRQLVERLRAGEIDRAERILVIQRENAERSLRGQFKPETWSGQDWARLFPVNEDEAAAEPDAAGMRREAAPGLQ